MMGQPPIVWHSAEDFIVSDRWGNRWLDWSSGVLITNVGHNHEVRKALINIINQGLLSTYVFVHEQRAELTEILQSLAPDPANFTVFF